MAKIAGRSNWLAVPAGLLCVAVVAALVWLALPMFPVSALWVGDMLRNASTPQPTAAARPTPAQLAAAGDPIDCRALYPDGLWTELSWHGGALLTQTAGAPATTVTSLTDALAPSPRVTCSWRLHQGGGIVTTLSAVGADAGGIADAALRGQGFTCTSTDAEVTCRRVTGDVIEEHTLRAGLWLSSIETNWHPEDYGIRLDDFVWNVATS